MKPNGYCCCYVYCLYKLNFSNIFVPILLAFVCGVGTSDFRTSAANAYFKLTSNGFTGVGS